MLQFQKYVSIKTGSNYSNKIKPVFKESYYKLRKLAKLKFNCPICGYQGPFVDVSPATGLRKHARCFRCGSMERHRLQKLVIDDVLKRYNPSRYKILHLAPESFFSSYFNELFEDYLSADLSRNDVDVNCDITSMPFKDEEFDFVYASHVLEHVQDDRKALSEVKRVLKPKGIAILPVPIVGKNTVEYLEPNPVETFHVRAPGEDYYERYSQIFSHVEQFSSLDFPDKYQTSLYEDRSIYPSKECPMRQPSLGEKHIDIVPVCFV